MYFKKFETSNNCGLQWVTIKTDHFPFPICSKIQLISFVHVKHDYAIYWHFLCETVLFIEIKKFATNFDWNNPDCYHKLFK